MLLSYASEVIPSKLVLRACRYIVFTNPGWILRHSRRRNFKTTFLAQQFHRFFVLHRPFPPLVLLRDFLPHIVSCVLWLEAVSTPVSWQTTRAPNKINNNIVLAIWNPTTHTINFIAIIYRNEINYHYLLYIVALFNFSEILGSYSRHFFQGPGEQRLVVFETLLLFTTFYCPW